MQRLGKRTLLSVLAIILTLSIVACSSSATKDSGPVTLTMLTHYVAANENFIKPYIDQWNKENPNIQIKLEGVEFDALLSTLMTKQTSGQGADINHIYSLWAGQLDKSGVIADPPTSVIDSIKENYPDSVTKGASVNGKIYGYPTEVQPFVLYYNKKLLKDKGFDSPPATWDQTLEMAKAIEQKDASGNTKIQGFGFIRSWPAIAYHPFVALMATAGGKFIENGKVYLDSEAAKKTMDFYSKVYGKKGITDIGIDVMKSFAVSQTAMAINAGWWAGTLKDTMKDAYKDVGTAPIPSLDGKTKGSVAYTWAWSVNKKSKHQDAAFKFLTWFNTKPIKNGMTAEGNFLLDAFNTISTNKIDAQSEPIKAKLAADPNVKVINEALQYATPEPNDAAGAEIQNILFKQLDSVWAGQKSGDDALKSAQTDIQAKLSAK
jgi:multiple sugar transport system substrate-binding protein